MKPKELIEYLKTNNLYVFTFLDIQRAVANKSYAKIFVHRMINSKLIERIKKGVYALNEADLEVVATSISYPSYISFLNALSFRNTIDQIPVDIDVVTYKYQKSLTFRGTKINFIKFKHDLIWGYARENLNGVAFIAETEKAILDSLYLHRFPLRHVDEAIKQANIEKLVDYTIKFSIPSVAKRIGYLLDEHGFDFYERLSNMIKGKYVYLSLVKSRKGKKIKKWLIIDNR